MNKSKIFYSFMVLAMFITWSIPQSGHAVDVDWFGNASQEKIKYYEGYNAALAAVTTKQLAMPTSISVSTTDVTNLQKQINVLTSKINVLEDQEPATIDDWGYNTSTENYVTNPMRENLDVNRFRIGNYYDSDAVYFDSDVNLGNKTLFGKYLNFTTMEDNSTLLRSIVRANDSTAANFGAIGENSFAVWALSEGTDSRAGYFEATGDNSVGVVAAAHGTGSYSGYFNGPVKMENGGLIIDHGNIKVDSANGSNGILSTVLVPGGTAIRGVATATSSLAGAFVGDVNIDGANLKFNTNAYLGNDSSGWGGLNIRSNNDVGVIFDANNDDPASAFRIMRDGENFDTAKEVMTFTTDPTGEYNAVEINKGTFVVNNPQKYLVDSSLSATPIGIAVAGNDFGIGAWSLDEDSGSGVLGSGFYGVKGRAIYPGGVGVYGEAVARTQENNTVIESYAGLFDGSVKLINGSLSIEDTAPRVHLEGNTPGIEFSNITAAANNKNWSFIAHENNFYGDVVGDHFSGGYHWLEVIRDGLDVESVNFPLGKVGIGTSNPNKQLDIYSSSTNAEIDIQTGANTHWGIYQDNVSGNLNFWHGDNKVIFTDQGLSTNGICLNGQCVNSWRELKKYLEPKVIDDPNIYPREEVNN